MELNVTQLEGVQMKLDKQIKRHSKKWMAHKRNLRNSTRFYLKTKNSTTEKCCGLECVTFRDLC